MPANVSSGQPLTLGTFRTSVKKYFKGFKYTFSKPMSAIAKSMSSVFFLSAGDAACIE
jgi:hypothetical protein